jgi:hypothetical protein
MSRPNFKIPTAPPKTALSAGWLKPAGTCLGVLLLLAGANLLLSGVGATPAQSPHEGFDLNYFWYVYYSGIKAHADIITGAILLGGAIGFIGLAWGWFDPTPPETAMKPKMFYGIGAGLTVFIALFILRCGMHQIGGYDHSILVEHGWRLFSGQTAYQDYPCTVPVMFPLGAKFAFQWFGVYWRSIIDVTAIFSMATFAWSLFLLAQLFGRNWTTLLWAMAVQIFSPMLLSFWWYSPITEVAAAVYTLAAMYWLRCPGDNRAVASYGAALLFMATTKPNVAGILILGFSVVFFISPRHRWQTVWVSLGAFALFLAVLSMNHLSFFGMLAAYRDISPRGASLIPFLLDLTPVEKRVAMTALTSMVLPVVLALCLGREGRRSTGWWIPAIGMLAGLLFYFNNTQLKLLALATLFLPFFAALWLGRGSLRAGVWIAIIGLFGGLYGCLTNTELILVHLPPVLIGSLLFVAQMRSPAFPGEGPVFQMPLWWNRYFALLCVVLGVCGLTQGFVRDRIKSIGPVQFFEWDDSRHTLNSGFFKGVHCGDVFDEVLKEVAEVLRREPSSTIWFGPRMQWAYAAFGKPSPLHQPVIWDQLTMFQTTKEEDYFKTFLDARAQVLIFFKNDTAHYSPEEVGRIVERYDVDQSFPLLTILRLKK